MLFIEIKELECVSNETAANCYSTGYDITWIWLNQILY